MHTNKTVKTTKTNIAAAITTVQKILFIRQRLHKQLLLLLHIFLNAG